MKANRMYFSKIKYNPLNFDIKVDSLYNHLTNGETIRVELEYRKFGITKKFYSEYIEITEKQRKNGDSEYFIKKAYYKLIKKKNDIIKNQNK